MQRLHPELVVGKVLELLARKGCRNASDEGDGHSPASANLG
jgi:hypothetical protein